MSRPRAVDCQGLAGAWTLGTVEAGFEIVHRASLPAGPHGFGDNAVEANRALLGDFPLEHGPQPEWTPQRDVAYVHGTPPCFAAGTVVLTGRGTLPIEQVKTGDVVYTHRHRWQRVLRTGSKRASCIRIGATVCTRDHRWYSADWPSLAAPRWTAARDLRGTAVATPSEVAPGIAEAPALGDDLWWVIGRWLGDGWARMGAASGSKSRMDAIICCGKHERDELAARLGPAWHETEERTGFKFTRCDRDFVAFLVNNFGKGAAAKRIPAWALSMPEGSRRALLDGYVSADGCIRGNEVRLGSVSKQLLVGARLLAAGLGHTTTLSQSHYEREDQIEGRAVRGRPAWAMSYRIEDDGRFSRREGGMVWTKLRKEPRDAGEQIVYDLEVEGDNSYTADGFVVHNCSGFSVYNTSKKANFRGADSPINSCMRDLVTYAARCSGSDGRRGAEVVAFESVQGAFKQGRSLMQALRQELEDLTGEPYVLTHVLMSGSSVGGAQYRHRYYFVAHRIPFGIEAPEPHHVTTVRDAIGDLQGLKLQVEEQPYVRGAYPNPPYASSRRRNDGLVDWHETREETHRIRQLIEHIDERTDWAPGEYLQPAVARIGRTRLIDELFPGRWNEDEGTLRGLPRHWPKRVDPGKPAWVVTGNSSLSFVHWSQPRPLTVRELTRLMGYPDAWTWPEELSVDQASSLVGKCCPVDSGRWISEQVRKAVEGRPAEAAEEIGHRERLHNSTLDYRRWPEEVSGYRFETKATRKD